MPEILSSIHNDFKERFSSPVYGVFIASWLAVNWEFVYTAFFVSEDKIWESTQGLLKNEYLVNTFFNYSSYTFYIHALLPVVLTWLFIWHFPKYISIPAFREAEQNRNLKIEIANNLKIKLSEQKLHQIEIEEETIEKEIDIVKSKREIGSEEYAKLRAHPLFKKIPQVIDVIYRNGGETRFWNSSGYLENRIDSDILAFLDTKGLLKIGGQGENENIELTELGKSVFAQYLEDNSKT